jgi:hypothetical protein
MIDTSKLEYHLKETRNDPVGSSIAGKFGEQFYNLSPFPKVSIAGSKIFDIRSPPEIHPRISSTKTG